jgi:hypothetical protein
MILNYVTQKYKRKQTALYYTHFPTLIYANYWLIYQIKTSISSSSSNTVSTL